MIIRKTHPTLLYGVKKRRLRFSSQNDATVKVIPKNVWLLLRNFISSSHLEVLKTIFAALEEKSVPVVSINQLIIYHESSGFRN